MEFDYLSDEHAEYIRDLVKKAAIADKNCEVFGASKHKYQLNQVLSEKEVRQFEKEYHVKLPEEYVFFLTKVGNGGAGPYYGIYSLNIPKLRTGQVICREGVPAFFDKNLTKEAWDEMMEKMEDDEKYDALEADMLEGVLVIGTQGCTYDMLLMCKGSEQGKLVYIDWNLEPELYPYLTGMTFLDWYESYFKEIIAGHKIHWYGYYSLKSEEELRSSYSEDLSLEEKAEILKGFCKFRKAQEETLDFLEQIKDDRLDAIRTELLLRFDFERGQAVFELLLSGKNTWAATECARSIPDSQTDKYYKRMIELLYEKNECSKSSIVFYLNRCTCLKASDVINFIVDESQEEPVRKNALWVISRCQDKLDFLEELMQLMRGESYKLALEALQIVMRKKIKSQKLLDTYTWMTEKYQNDSIMMSNLKVGMDTMKTVL